MRYRQIPMVDFKNARGETKKIRQERLESIGNVTSILDKLTEQNFDELTVKIFGQRSEYQTYKLRDQNIIALLDYDFDESRITKVTLGDTF